MGCEDCFDAEKVDGKYIPSGSDRCRQCLKTRATGKPVVKVKPRTPPPENSILRKAHESQMAWNEKRKGLKPWEAFLD